MFRNLRLIQLGSPIFWKEGIGWIAMVLKLQVHLLSGAMGTLANLTITV
jgi:hypothetical protein